MIQTKDKWLLAILGLAGLGAVVASSRQLGQGGLTSYDAADAGLGGYTVPPRRPVRPVARGRARADLYYPGDPGSGGLGDILNPADASLGGYAPPLPPRRPPRPQARPFDIIGQWSVLPASPASSPWVGDCPVQPAACVTPTRLPVFGCGPGQQLQQTSDLRNWECI